MIMTTTKTLLVLGILVFSTAASHAQEFNPRQFTTREASEARLEYDQAIQQASIEFSRKLSEARKFYMSKLSIAQEQLASEINANPDEVLRIAAEQQRIAALLVESEQHPQSKKLTPAADIKITGRMYELGTLRDGELTYQDHKDEIQWDMIPREIDGWHITRFVLGNPPRMYVTAATAGRVFVIAPAGANYPGHPLRMAGWKATKFINIEAHRDDFELVEFDDTANNPMSWMLYHRVFRQGEEVQVPQDGVHGAPIVVPVPSLILD